MSRLENFRKQFSRSAEASRPSANQNRLMYHAVCFSVDHPASQIPANVFSDYEISLLKPEYVVISAEGYSKTVSDPSEATHYRCKVYYPEIESIDRDPTVEDQFSQAYWRKVLNLNTAIFPQKGWLWSAPPAHMTVWEVLFKQGGPEQGDFKSGWADKCNDDSGMTQLLLSFQSLSSAVTSGASATGSGVSSSQGAHNSGPSTGNASTEFYHNKCVNGVLVQHQGRNQDGHLDPNLHDDRHAQLITDARTLQDGNEYNDFDSKFSWFDLPTYVETLKVSESSGNQLAWEGAGNGYLGWYQMGYDAIYDNGYFPGVDETTYDGIVPSSGDKYTEEITSEFFYQADWDSAEAQKIYTPAQRAKLKAAQDKAKNDPTFENKKEIANVWMGFSTVQNNLMAKYTASRLQSLADNGLVDLSDSGQANGLAASAHLGGVGRVNDRNDPNYENRNGVYEWVELGQPPTFDANGTKISSYYKNAQDSHNALNDPCTAQSAT